MKDRILIEDCGFTIRTINVIKSVINPFNDNERIKFIDELQQFTSLDIRKVRNVGQASLREIRKILAAHGLKLKDDFLASSDEEKKLIQEMPKLIMEISDQFRDLSRKIDWIKDKLDTMHSNMRPL